jgi:hypothetical protein
MGAIPFGLVVQPVWRRIVGSEKLSQAVLQSALVVLQRQVESVALFSLNCPEGAASGGYPESQQCHGMANRT